MHAGVAAVPQLLENQVLQIPQLRPHVKRRAFSHIVCDVLTMPYILPPLVTLALLPLVIPEVPSPDRIPPPQFVQVPVGSTTKLVGVIPVAQIPLPAVTAVGVLVSVSAVGSFGDALSVAHASKPECHKEDKGSNQHQLPHFSHPLSVPIGVYDSRRDPKFVNNGDGSYRRSTSSVVLASDWPSRTPSVAAIRDQYGRLLQLTGT